jgi:hypothetical protein
MTSARRGITGRVGERPDAAMVGRLAAVVGEALTVARFMLGT